MKIATYSSLLRLGLGLLLLPVGSAFAQAPAWQTAMVIDQADGDNNGSSGVTATATDASGNVYLAGNFRGTVRFGTTALTSAGGSDVFVAKYSPATASFVWVQQLGGPYLDDCNGLAVVGANLYLTGVLSQGGTFGGATLTENTADGSLYVARLTDAGSSASFTWASRPGGAGGAAPYNLVASGPNLYLSGVFSGNITLGTQALTGGDLTIFVAKLTDTGTGPQFGWTQQGGGRETFPAGLAVSGSNVYLSGYFNSTAQFGATTLTSAGSNDIFVTKLTDAGSAGSFGWAKRAGGSGADRPRALAVHNANVYVVGSFESPTAGFGSSTITHEGSGLDSFVAQLTDESTDATFGWAQRLGSPNDDVAFAVTTAGDNVYVAGTFAGTTASFGAVTLSNTDAPTTAHVFVTRLRNTSVVGGSAASFGWAQQATGATRAYGQTLAVSNGQLYVGGSISAPATFGPIAIARPLDVTVGFLASLSDKDGLGATAATPAAGLSLRPYPNPVSGGTQVQVPGAGSTTRLTLLDALGRPVRQVAGAALDVQNVAPGLYLLQAVTPGQAPRSARLVVE
jgi:hypothetical protein